MPDHVENIKRNDAIVITMDIGAEKLIAQHYAIDSKITQISSPLIDYSGFPARVVSINPPFILAESIDGKVFTVDIRKQLFQKVTKDYLTSFYDCFCRHGGDSRKAERWMNSFSGRSKKYNPNKTPTPRKRQ